MLTKREARRRLFEIEQEQYKLEKFIKNDAVEESPEELFLKIINGLSIKVFKTDTALIYHKDDDVYFELYEDAVYVNYRHVMSPFYYGYYMEWNEFEELISSFIRKHLNITSFSQIKYPERRSLKRTIRWDWQRTDNEDYPLPAIPTNIEK